MENKWKELKEHAEKQQVQASKINSTAGNVIAHVWRDVLNKMWSIEKKHDAK